jgi:hypothetical protein
MADSKIDHGGFAFPTTEIKTVDGRILDRGSDGMSKREYYAGKAMAGLLAGNAIYNGKSDDRAALAKDAVAHADALIAALKVGA